MTAETFLRTNVFGVRLSFVPSRNGNDLLMWLLPESSQVGRMTGRLTRTDSSSDVAHLNILSPRETYRATHLMAVWQKPNHPPQSLKQLACYGIEVSRGLSPDANLSIQLYSIRHVPEVFHQFERWREAAPIWVGWVKADFSWLEDRVHAGNQLSDSGTHGGTGDSV